jgi:enoyl-CoA hydratase/carnithine racemase
VGEFMYAVLAFSKLLVACVHGPALGIGATLLAHCDYVIASPHAYLETPFAFLGLVPEFCSSVTFPRLFGRQRATAVLMLGQRLSARECAQAGLYSRVVEDVSAEELLAMVRNGRGGKAVKRGGEGWIRHGRATNSLRVSHFLSQTTRLFPPGAGGPPIADAARAGDG